MVEELVETNNRERKRFGNKIVIVNEAVMSIDWADAAVISA